MVTFQEQIAAAQMRGFTRYRLWTQDETRVGLLPLTRHRITALGVQPTIKSELSREYLYLFGAIEPATGEDFMLELPGLETATLQVFLDEFAKQDKAGYHLLLVDHASAHRTPKLRVPENVGFIFLPPQSPELKPIERFWRELKDWLSDYEPERLSEVSELISQGLQEFPAHVMRSVTGYEYVMRAWEQANA